MRGSAAILARLRWIDDRIFWTGRLSRSEVSKAFSISITQASIDISEYARLAPGNIVPNTDRSYGPSAAFSPLFPKEPRAFLESAQCQPGGFPLSIERRNDPWSDASPAVLAALAAAAVARVPVEASFRGGRAVLSPYRIVDDGKSLFVRGWDHMNAGVGLFSLANLDDLRPQPSIPWIDASADRPQAKSAR